MEAGTLLADFYISQYRLSRVVQALLFVFEDSTKDSGASPKPLPAGTNK
ncbi:predicted protein [Botrytis cinerea T4]|uniref:Uncharacterized protein n=1 Tax=Botryotinia fuckeliana (strain T4) TaxID=999810 RepID=G2YKN0_BOTF4|nr:predicted protein [Botrytis cinerea T4]